MFASHGSRDLHSLTCSSSIWSWEEVIPRGRGEATREVFGPRRERGRRLVKLFLESCRKFKDFMPSRGGGVYLLSRLFLKSM